MGCYNQTSVGIRSPPGLPPFPLSTQITCVSMDACMFSGQGSGLYSFQLIHVNSEWVFCLDWGQSLSVTSMTDGRRTSKHFSVSIWFLLSRCDFFFPLDKDIELSFKEIAKSIFLETGPKNWMFFFLMEHKEAILKPYCERLVNILIWQLLVNHSKMSCSSNTSS